MEILRALRFLVRYFRAFDPDEEVFIPVRFIPYIPREFHRGTVQRLYGQRQFPIKLALLYRTCEVLEKGIA